MDLSKCTLSSPVVATFCFIAFALGIGTTRMMQAYYMRYSYLSNSESNVNKDKNSIKSSQVIMKFYVI